MQSPLCEVCLNSDILCAGCSGKLEAGELTQEAIGVSRFLFGMRDKAKGLDDARIKSIISTDILLLVTGKGDVAKVVGKGGMVVKALAKQFNKNVKVLEEGEFKPFISDLLYPVSISGINILYKPDCEIHRIRAPLHQKSKLHISEGAFSNIVEELYRKKVEIFFED